MTTTKKIILVTSIVLSTLLGIYLGFSLYFMHHFYFGTMINGVDVSGKDVESAKTAIQTAIDAYELTFVERDGTTESIIGNTFGLIVNWDDEIEVLLNQQNGFCWIEKVIEPDIHNTVTKLSYDENKLYTILTGLSCMKPEKQIAPEDAKISEYAIGEGYKVIPASMGSKINETALRAKVNEYIHCLKKELNLDMTYCYELPYVMDDNERLVSAITQLNKSLETVITYQVGDETQVLDATTFQPWLSVNANLEVVVDEDAVSEYVKELASAYNTFYKTKHFMTSYGVEVSISNSRYGWLVDKQAEKEAIVADILAGEQITRDLNYSVTANSRVGNDFGNSYVEINLTAQHLFLYVDGVLIMESDFVSGNVSKSYYTPTGAFAITYKERNATLNGDDYSTPVDYWMPFAGNVGMHDATWRGSFGGNIYLTNGSHGCVNLPWSSAKKIFENVKAGFPVLVYQLPGTENY